MGFGLKLFASALLVTAGAGVAVTVVARWQAGASSREQLLAAALNEARLVAELIPSHVNQISADDARLQEQQAQQLVVLQRVAQRLPAANTLTTYAVRGETCHPVLRIVADAPEQSEVATSAQPLPLPPDAQPVLANGLPVLVATPPPSPPSRAVCFAAIKDASGQVQGLLALELDRSRLQPALGATERLAWLPFALSLGLGVLVGWLARQRLGRPIERLLATAVAARTGRPAPALAAPGGGSGPVYDAVRTIDGMAAELRKHAVFHDDRVRQRTQELEATCRLKDEFIATTAHELRTSLTTILASLDILHEGFASTPQEQAEFLEQAMVASRHLMFIVNDLLDTAAFEAGKLRIDLRQWFVRDLLEDAERLMRPMAMKRGITLAVEAPREDFTILGDRTRVLQVIFNLLGNALKYSPDDTHVTLRACTTPMGAAFEVEDEGLGVPVSMRRKLFTKFGQAHSPDSSSASGTGIGLYLCKILVEQMHGSIGFREREGGPGSVFWFSLPTGRRGVPPAAAAATATAQEPAPQPPPPARSAVPASPQSLTAPVTDAAPPSSPPDTAAAPSLTRER